MAFTFINDVFQTVLEVSKSRVLRVTPCYTLKIWLV